MVNTTSLFPESSAIEYDDPALFAQLAYSPNTAQFVVNEFTVSPNYTDLTVTISDVVASLYMPSMTTEDHRDDDPAGTASKTVEECLVTVQLPGETLSLADGSTNYIYVVGDDSDSSTFDDVSFQSNATGSQPAPPSLKIAEVDTSENSTTKYNQHPDGTYETLEVVDSFTDPAGVTHTSELAEQGDPQPPETHDNGKHSTNYAAQGHSHSHTALSDVAPDSHHARPTPGSNIVESAGAFGVRQYSNGGTVDADTLRGQTPSEIGGGEGSGQYGTMQAVVYRDGSGNILAEIQNGSVVTDGSTLSSNDLASVINATYGDTDAAGRTIRSITVNEGVYAYTTDIDVPTEAHLHFENVTLQPDGCRGVMLGNYDATNNVFQHVTGDVRIEPNSGGTTATDGIHLRNTKHLIWGAFTEMPGGFSNAALNLDGGMEGSWWNSLRDIHTSGRLWKHHDEAGGEAPNNAITFSDSLFRGQMDILAGNSFAARNCFFETIPEKDNGGSGEHFPVASSDWETINLQAEAALHGRFEQVSIETSLENFAWIHADRWVDSGINDPDGGEATNLPVDYTDNTTGHKIVLTGPGFEADYRTAHNSNGPLQVLKQTGAYTVPDEAVLELINTYTSTGDNNLIRAVAGGRDDGYFLRGVGDDDDVDKDIEVRGDYVNNTAGQGVVLTTPDGSAKYRLSVDNSGNLQINSV